MKCDLIMSESGFNFRFIIFFIGMVIKLSIFCLIVLVILSLVSGLFDSIVKFVFY